MSSQTHLVAYSFLHLITFAFFASAVSCTKKATQPQSPGPLVSSTPETPISAPPLPTAGAISPDNQNVEVAPNRFALTSIAGENIFCQNFSTKNSLVSSDIEGVVNTMAGVHAGLPAEVINPFTVQTLALALKSKPCDQIPQLMTAGHCALVVHKKLATGTIEVQTEQRLFWKDIPILAQAASVKTTLDSKTNAIASKNTFFGNVQKQLTQQRMLVQILETTSGGSPLFKEAKSLLASLQEQSESLNAELQVLESELKPIQDELNKRVEELNTARSALKSSCLPATMGAISATWKEN